MISPAEDKSDTQKNNKVSMWQAGLAPGAPYSVCIFHLCYIQLSDKCGRKENEKRGGDREVWRGDEYYLTSPVIFGSGAQRPTEPVLIDAGWYVINLSPYPLLPTSAFQRSTHQKPEGKERVDAAGVNQPATATARSSHLDARMEARTPTTKRKESVSAPRKLHQDPFLLHRNRYILISMM